MQITSHDKSPMDFYSISKSDIELCSFGKKYLQEKIQKQQQEMLNYDTEGGPAYHIRCDTEQIWMKG